MQPLSTDSKKENSEIAAVVPAALSSIVAQIPGAQTARRARFEDAQVLDMYEDGTPGEVFVTMAKEG